MSGRAIAFSSKVVLHKAASLALRFRKTLLAGKFSNRAWVWTIVPVTGGTVVITWSSVTDAHILQVPLVISSRETAAMEARASPLKPRVDKFSKSVSLEILLVACGRAQAAKSSLLIPQPLSFTRIFSMPPPVISTLIFVAPESTALSKSSRTIAFGLSITSPAAIFLATSALNCLTLASMEFPCYAFLVPFTSEPGSKKSSTGPSPFAGDLDFLALGFASFSSSSSSSVSGEFIRI